MKLSTFIHILQVCFVTAADFFFNHAHDHSTQVSSILQWFKQVLWDAPCCLFPHLPTLHRKTQQRIVLFSFVVLNSKSEHSAEQLHSMTGRN